MNNAELTLLLVALVMIFFGIPLLCCVCHLSTDGYIEDTEDNYSTMEENPMAPTTTERDTPVRAFG